MKITNNIKTAVVIICFSFSQSLSAQSINNYEYAQQVFDKLVKTINLSSPAKPKLVIVADPGLIARTYPEGEIKIGAALIDHCRQFGADSCNALAHVLSHELTHYYDNHFWTQNFGTSYADMAWGEEIAKSGQDTSVIKLYETQADEYGMYYAFSAGYTTLHVAAKVLDSIYAWYHLRNTIPGYPSLAERKQIADEAEKNISALIPSFETGNFLMELSESLSGNYQSSLTDLAISCYQNIIDNGVRTKEMYNNIAVGKIILSRAYAPDSTRAIRFPLLLETRSYLYQANDSRGENEADEGEMDALLIEAENLCENAIHLDRNFYPAYVNLSIIYYLQQKFGAASDALDEAKKIMGENNPMIWTVCEMSALIASTKGNTQDMDYDFALAQKYGSPTAAYNMEIVQSRMNNSGSADVTADTTEMNGGKWIGDYLNQLNIPKKNRSDLKDGKAIIFIDTMNNYIVFDIKPESADIPFRKIRFMMTSENSDQRTSKGLKINDAEKQLVKLYGNPAFTIPESGKTIYCYPAQNLFVWLDNDKVSKWCYWWVK